MLVGIDIGTTNIKVIAFTRRGEAACSCSRKNKITTGREGYRFDGEYIFATALEMLRELVAEGIEVESIGISSFAETVFPVGRESPLQAQAIAWYDTRTEQEMQRFLNSFGLERFKFITGLKPNYTYSIHKLAWHYRNQPRLFRRVECWLPANSYLVYRLTGGRAMDYSLASRTGALDIMSRSWSEAIFSALPFDEEVFATLRESGEVVGGLRSCLASGLGCRSGIPVSLGGHDHICGAFASAAHRSDVILDSMGTAENVQVAVEPETLELEQLFARGIHVGAHVIPNRLYIYQGMKYSGAVIDNLLALFLARPVAELKEEDFALFVREAAEYADRQVRAEIHIGGNEDGYSDFNIMDIPPGTQRGEVFMAAVRYICRRSREMIASIEEVTGANSKVVVIGGSTRNELLMKEKAKTLDRKLWVNTTEEAVTLGAALLGGVGAGKYESHVEAVEGVEQKLWAMGF